MQLCNFIFYELITHLKGTEIHHESCCFSSNVKLLMAEKGKGAYSNFNPLDSQATLVVRCGVRTKVLLVQ